MYLSIFAVYDFSIDSRALYEELKPYQINVTDVIKTVFVNGRIEDSNLPKVIFILLKYGDAIITINK